MGNEIIKTKTNKDISYSIGLDVGTNSVGWAVIDSNYQLLKKGNKHLWGARLFDSAETAVERRGNRSTRRRYNKRRERIRLLREIMNDMVLEKDPAFFIRMRDASFLNESDKMSILENNFKGNYNLFSDYNFTDVDFYNQFPTIYHLRDYLCTTKEKADPRFIYLALHHIVKYRGNFLYENKNFSSVNDNIEEDLSSVLENIIEINNMDYHVNSDQICSLLEILKKKIPRKQKSDECIEVFSTVSEYKKIIINISNAICGNNFSVTKLFVNEDIRHNEKELKLKFSDDNYDTEISDCEFEIGDYIEIINDLQNIYSWMELQNILGNENNENTSLSKAMIKRFEKHKEDLVLLKKVIKNYDKKLYYEIFRSTDIKLHNYVNYINHPKEITKDLFYTYIKKILDKINSDDAIYCIGEIGKENFLLRQNDKNNGSIPFQLNLIEMKQILKNQSKYYPALKNNSDKITSILTFRIPYYYGPLDGNKVHGWLVKNEGKENERILPWNHSDVVNVEKTASNFIKSLINFCTYLPDEFVMPKYSLTCKKYEVLAELNKIRINGHLIKDSEMKNQIIEDLFMKKKKVTDAHLRTWLKKNNIYMNCEELEITGYQKDKAFSSTMDSWIDFSAILGKITNENYSVIEQVIEAITIYNEPNILKKRISKIYNKFSDKQLIKILKLNYSGWSRLSSKLINGIYADNKYGSSATILDVMEHSNKGLMEIITDKTLGYKKIIDNANKIEAKGSFQYEDVANLAGSPAIKKGIWQSLLVVDEIVQYMKHKPTNIYIEFAREEGIKMRTQSQVKRLQTIYASLNLQEKEDKVVYNQLKNEDATKTMKNERLYLYYTQMGKCMYSGESLEIGELDKYQVDHIVPQSLIKDDSLDNKVLVLHSENQRKFDDDVVPEAIQNKQQFIWKKLLDNKLISQKKYFALVRPELSDDMKIKFINRQLVETRQIIKNVANILISYYPETKVNALRANMTSTFRKKYNIYKNRNVNDFHHAHDAYIVATLGLYVNRRYPRLDAKYDFSKFTKFNKDNKKGDGKDGFILNSMNSDFIDIDTGEVIWQNTNINDIKKCFNYHDCFISRKLEENDSSLFKITVVPNDMNSENGKTKAKVPMNSKRADVHKYGGYLNIQYIMYAIEGFDEKNRIIRKVINFPLMLKNANLEEKLSYIENHEKLKNITIIKEILKNQLVEIDDEVYWLSSSNELITARQLLLPNNYYELVYKINHALKENDFENLNHENLNQLYVTLVNKIIDYHLKYIEIAKKLSDSNEFFLSLDKKEKCKIINEVINVLAAGKQNGNFKNLGLSITSKRAGRLSSKKINLENTVFYNQSITGIYTKKYKL